MVLTYSDLVEANLAVWTENEVMRLPMEVARLVIAHPLPNRLPINANSRLRHAPM